MTIYSLVAETKAQKEYDKQHPLSVSMFAQFALRRHKRAKIYFDDGKTLMATLKKSALPGTEPFDIETALTTTIAVYDLDTKAFVNIDSLRITEIHI